MQEMELISKQERREEEEWGHDLVRRLAHL